MGKQLSFYLSPQDEASLLAQLNEHCGVRVVYNVFDTPDQMSADPLPALGANPPYDNNLSLIPASFEPRLALHVQQGYTRILTADSECIQLTRTTLLGQQYCAGRLWYEPQRDSGRNKRKLFLDWANCVFKHLRRELSRNPDYSNRYFGPVMLSQLQKGQIAVSPY